MGDAAWVARPLSRDDRDAWARLFRGYAEFYETPMPDETLDLVWSWIHDEGTVRAIVAVAADGSGEPVGLAHLRPWLRPLRGVGCGYLDDLFVDPPWRGTGVVEVLFAAIEAMALAEGWSIVRWTTREDNHRARRVYDRHAQATSWVTYDMEIGDRG
jgi:GNAT superfamily N-acetyltransferase